ncbi:ABC transporter permease [candidate division KSB1 bacterium]|nr:ABC transporter permease [candidate division KSB1 bacterium]
MFKNYLKIALRNLLRHKIHTLINIAGLAVGIACCILILLFVRNEITYDRFHEKADQIYRVYKFEKRTDGDHRLASLPPPLALALTEEFPEIERTVRFFLPFNEATKPVRYGDNWLEEKVHFADADFFAVFTFPLLKGNPATALRDPDAVVLGENFAATCFGNDDPIGKRITIRLGGSDQDFIVTGVAKNMPENSSVKFAILLNYQKVKDELRGFFGENVLTSWNNFTEIYVQISEQAQAAALQARLAPIVEKHRGNLVQSWRLANVPEAFQLHLQPLTDIHLDPTIQGGIVPASNPAYSYILSGFALLLLLLACVNFMTLAVGRSISRAREVGMRKVLGAARIQLMRQFWGEALLLSFLSLLLGWGLAELLLPVFNELAEKNLAIDFFANWNMLPTLIGLMLVTGLTAGSYPAVVLSQFHPVDVLKGALKLGGKNRLTQTLVVLQFALCIALIISTLVMFRQLHYVRTKDLGFNKEQVVIIPTHTQGADGANLLALYKNELATDNRIINVTGSDGLFARTSLSLSVHTADKNFEIATYRADENYLATLGIELAEGRNFSRKITTDAEEAVLINESLVKALGWDAAIGKEVPVGFPSKTVIGVMKDFHFDELHHEIQPLLLNMHPGRPIQFILARISPVDISGTLGLLRQAWQKLAPNSPFTYSFLDEEVGRHYKTEVRWEKTVNHASVLSIFISGLGLFGLTAVAVTKRTKEIGIRKVMGATAARIALLISGEFLALVFIAFIVAAPIAYWAMNRWLQDFAYRIDISWWVFILAGGLALVVVLLTVSTQAIKAALANPVEALRYE